MTNKDDKFSSPAQINKKPQHQPVKPYRRKVSEADLVQGRKMRNYYAFQSKIYDSTRWSFLFGRKAILKELPFTRTSRFTLLEVGCGTGHNLKSLLTLYPNAQLIGIDVSSDMLKIAQQKTTHSGNRLQLIEGSYGQVKLHAQPDVILFSYCLTMVNPHWVKLLRQANLDLGDHGSIAIVDFHHGRNWFRRHMKKHHVRMDAHLLPFLEEEFVSKRVKVRKAYGGIWSYMSFIGSKK
ncbi:MAG: class I SAM-dependent methyltransferase [Bacteroidota bacterium]